MRLARVLVPLAFLASYAAANDAAATAEAQKVKHNYQVS